MKALPTYGWVGLFLYLQAMEVTNKTYRLGEQEFIYRPNTRAMIEFERIAKKPAALSSGFEDNILFLYCGTVAGMKKAGREFNMTFEDFIDLVDDHYDVLASLVEEAGEEKKP